MPVRAIEDVDFLKRTENAEAIAKGLEEIPSDWALTPVSGKQPKRKGWQSEEPLSKFTISQFILSGEFCISATKGEPYLKYASGYGLRTGDISNGLLAIDVDGESAEPILRAMAKGDLPVTVSWTSGKPGRYQMLFRIPDFLRTQLANFRRSVVTEYEGLKTLHENGKPIHLLEFRYNNVQSVVPPSFHPTTGAYKWIVKPDENHPVAIAPQWLCDIVLKLKDQSLRDTRNPEIDWTKYVQQVTSSSDSVSQTLVEFLHDKVYPMLSPRQIFYWTGHDFKAYGTNIFKGKPPWRESISGTAFNVWWDGHQWAWQDWGTGMGGGAIQYFWKMKGNTGTPKGRDFYEIVKELAAIAGVEMPHNQQRLQHRLPAEKPRGLQEEEKSLVSVAADMIVQSIDDLSNIKSIVTTWSVEFTTAVWTILPPEIQEKYLISIRTNSI